MGTSTFQITFIGAGRMASAMIKSLLRGNHYTPEQIACCSAKDGTAEKLAEETGISIIDLDTCSKIDTDALVLACKPQQIDTISAKVIESSSEALLISILAGTQIGKINAKFPDVRNTVRVMPNTPGSIGEGMSSYTPANSLSDDDRQTVETLLSSMGKYIEVTEPQIDDITAISGSGPAYLFLFVEGLYAAAQKLGFDDETAMLLAKQTVTGSAKLLEQSGETPENLRIQVTSPGGTTHEAVESFKKNGLFDVIEKATVACRERSIELGKL